MFVRGVNNLHLVQMLFRQKSIACTSALRTILHSYEYLISICFPICYLLSKSQCINGRIKMGCKNYHYWRLYCQSLPNRKNLEGMVELK